MKKIIFPFVIFFTHLFIYAQVPEWIINTGVSIEMTEMDNDGNIYATGVFTGTIDVDPSNNVFNLTSNGEKDVFLIKYNLDGNMLWAISFGSTGIEEINSLKIYNNEIYLFGRFNETVDFNPNSNFINSLTNTNSVPNAYLAKYNLNDGSYIWAGKIGNTEFPFHNGSIFVTENYIYLIGSFSGTMDFDFTSNTYTKTAVGIQDTFIAAYNLDTTLAWCNTIGSTGSECYGKDIVVDSNGNIIISGLFKGNDIDFDPSTTSSFLLSSYQDNYNFYRTNWFISKYNSLGNHIITIRYFHSTETNLEPKLFLGRNNELYLTFNNIFGGTFNLFYYVQNLCKFNQNLDLIWRRNTNNYEESGVFYDLKTDSNNNILFGGSLSEFYGISIFFTKYNSDGNPLYNTDDPDLFGNYFQNIYSEDSYGTITSIEIFNNTDYILAGNQGHNVDFDFRNDHTLLFNEHNFLIKYNNSFVLNNNDFELNNDLFNIHPNPTSSKIYINSSLEENAKGILTIYNVLGKKVYTQKIISPLNNYAVDLESLEKGIYFLELKTKSRTLKKKIIKK